MAEYYVVSFSGGKDSTAMLLRLIEIGQQVDEVIFCDTYKEFPAMYEHVAKVKEVVEAAGIKFTELRAEKSFDYYMFDHEVKRKKPIEGAKGYSWPDARARWCTQILKTGVIDKYIKNLPFQVIQFVGIAADETQRLDRKIAEAGNRRYPLVEWGWTEADCLKYCYYKGYTWNGLYKHFSRLSCWCCPLKSLDELRIMKKHYPELWQQLLEMDSKTWRQYKATYSVAQLDKRFDFEDSFSSTGKSIRSREFFKQLKEILEDGADTTKSK